MLLTGLTFAALLAWAWLLLARGDFWRADVRLPAEAPRPEDSWPGVVAVIPARNEAETIEPVLRAHAASAYPGAFRVVLVDDGSTDGTGTMARRVAAEIPRPIEVIAAPPLAPGWTGKMNAVAAGVAHARETAPQARWLLLTDADIVHAPETLSRLVGFAEARGLALASLMARLDARGRWGGLLIPAFVFFFQKLYPFPWIADPARRMAGAAGGCVLLRADALEEAGGIAAIRGALIDDCALAERIKAGPSGRRIWLGLADREVVSLRDNRALGAIWTMVRRTAFTQLGHSWALLTGSVAGMALVYLAGPLAALTWPLHGNGTAALLGLAAWALSALAYAPTVRLYGFSPVRAVSLPLAALLYTAMTVDSAARHALGRGGAWKGRTYP